MKAPAQQPVIFNSIAALMRAIEQPGPQHPLVALINYKNVYGYPVDAGMSYMLNFYKISFKPGFKGKVRYGQGYYDFEDGGLAFLAPGQVVSVSGEYSVHGSVEGYSLFFHPDLIRNYPLCNAIGKYGFFSYAVSEALFLSHKEKQIMTSLFTVIANELETNIDHFSQDVIVSQLELLLNYSNRFYNRQFITRKAVYNDLIGSMDQYLSQRFCNQHTGQTGLPTVQEVAEHLSVSPRYLTDMLKSLTGQSTQQHIHNRLIEKAKDILSTSNLTIAEIAYDLGFEHPQSFNKLFKQKTKLSPVAFRQSFN